MSRYTYAGDFKNPTTGWQVIPNPNTDVGGYVIGIPITDSEIVQALRNDPQEAQQLMTLRDQTGGYRLHTNNTVWTGEDAEEEAYEYIQSMEEHFERDYDEYLEENGPELARMERYEQWRNEY